MTPPEGHSPATPLLPATDTTAEPIAQTRFAHDELFFSITDPRGVILHANATFVRVAGYAIDELRGKPHNIVRDPAMPRGAFRLVWDELDGGAPAASYVANRAKDGERYEVFAVMLPIQDGFLSIRLAPHAPELRRTVLSIYDHARRLEGDADASARDTAALGRDAILESLRAEGIGDLATFTRLALPKEVGAYLRATPPHFSKLADSELGVILNATGAIAGAMRHLLDTVDELEVLTDQLALQRNASTPRAQQLRELRAQVDRATDVAAASAASPEPGGIPAEYLAELSDGILSRVDTALLELERLPDELDGVRFDAETLALQISLFALQNEMIARFATELISGQSVEDPGDAMRLLHHSLAAQSAKLSADTQRLAERASTIPAGISRAVAEVDRTRRRLFRWHEAVAQSVSASQPAEAEDILDLADGARQNAQDGFAWLDDLANLAAKLSLLNLRLDTAELDMSLQLVETATAGIP